MEVSFVEIPMKLLNVVKNDKSLKRLVIAGFCFLATLNYTFKKFKYGMRQLQRMRYPKDVVILHRLHKGFKTPHDKPTLVKLETWLKMSEIPYETEVDAEVLRIGPYITYNFKDVIGANRSIDYLSKLFNKDLDGHLNDNEKAIARCFKLLAEESLKWVIGLSMFVLEPDSQVSGFKKYQIKLTGKYTKNTTYHQGYGRHSKDEIYSIGIADLKALNAFIDNKRYLMGDKICNADATIFAYITQIINHDKGNLHDYLINECPNLIRYNQTIKDEYWQNWDEVIRHKKPKIEQKE